VLDCAFHLRPQPTINYAFDLRSRERGVLSRNHKYRLFLSVCKQFLSVSVLSYLDYTYPVNLTVNFSELFTNIRPRLRIIHERILNHYNSHESNSNLPIRIRIRRIRIRIEFFHFFKIRIRRIEYSNTPATDDLCPSQRPNRGIQGNFFIGARPTRESPRVWLETSTSC
jgi:hypothetical protein